MTRTTIHSDYIPDNAITGVKIAENSITAREIATNAITTLYVADDSVTADKLANSINVDIATGVAALPKAGGTMTGNITLGDNNKAIFGAGSDLQIYHDGSNSIIDEVGTGNLFIRGTNINIQNQDANPDENMITAVADGAVTLYHNGAEKIVTTSTGVDVTGTATMDGLTIENGYLKIINSGQGSGIELADINGNPSFKIVTDQQSAYNTAIVNTWGNSSNAGVLLGTSRSDGVALQVAKNITVNSTTGLPTDGGTTIFIVKGDGKVGIGTDNPGDKLTIEGSGAQVLSIYSTDTGSQSSAKTFINLYGENTAGEKKLQAQIASAPGHNASSAGELHFSTNNSSSAITRRMTIREDGNVGIGTASPTEKLHIFNSAQTWNQYANIRMSTESDSHAAEIGFHRGSGSDSDRGLFLSGDGTNKHVRVLHTGAVGIGTTSPQHELQVFGAQPTLSIRDSTSGSGGTWTLNREIATLDFMTSDPTGIGAHAVAEIKVVSGTNGDASPSGDMTFTTASYNNSAEERMRITYNGNLIVGKTSTDFNTAGFHLAPEGALYSGIQTASASSTYHVRDTTNNAWKFYVTGTGQIHATSTSITSLSDERLKENIKDLETGLTEVMALKPRRFDWKNKANTNVAGFVAQEVETVLPDLIGDFMHDDLEDAKSVKMGDMIPTLVKAIQEQQTQIEILKIEIQELKG